MKSGENLMCESKIENAVLQEIEKQIMFCCDLMNKLRTDFYANESKEALYSWELIANKTPMKNDVRRLRRELMDLYKMLERV